MSRTLFTVLILVWTVFYGIFAFTQPFYCSYFEFDEVNVTCFTLWEYSPLLMFGIFVVAVLVLYGVAKVVGYTYSRFS